MSQPRNAIYIIAVLHLVGIFGLNSGLREFFSLLTPVNLLVAAGLMLYSTSGLNAKGVFGLLFVVLSGFAVEWVGVNTGFPFGNYAYGTVLGPKVGNTPLLIGVNWGLLAFTSLLIARRITSNVLFISIIAGALMMGLDILIEPVAIQTGMWHWYGEHPPLQNYIAWFVIATVLTGVLHKLAPTITNEASVGFYTIQVVFFAVMNLC